MPTHQIKNVSIRRLRANPRNVRTHSKKQVRQIADSIRQFGFTAAIITDENSYILAGHGRWLAAKLLGLHDVPTVVIAGLSDARRRAYVLADNKLAEKAGWDGAALAVELNDLGPLLAEIGLNIDLTGFEPSEIDSLMGDQIDREHDPADDFLDVVGEPVSRIGDLWVLGKHRLGCGDARVATDLRRLMAGGRAATVITDPPYNVPTSSIQGRGKIKHRNFVTAAGEMSVEEFARFLISALSLAAQHSADGSIHFIFMDWRHLSEMMAAGKEVYTELKNLVVWAKTNAGQGTFYRSQDELVFVFKNGDSPHRNNFELGQHGRHRSNVWTYAGVNSFRSGRLDDLAIHPTVKPVALVADAMRDCSRRGEIVLDPFMGSGTSILAAERVGRRAYGLDLDPLYVDVAMRRWQAFTKRDAILEGTRKTFEDVAISRASIKRRRAG
jgi:DNA modification methylase